MVVNLSDRVLAWAWVASLASAVGVMLRPLPNLVNELTSDYPQSDIALHFSLFIYLRILPQAATWGRTRSAGIAIGLVAMGLGLEAAQSLTGTRTASWGDAIANTAGVLVGSCLGPLLKEVRGKYDR